LLEKPARWIVQDDPEPDYPPVVSALLWIATITIPLLIGGAVIGSLAYLFWALAHSDS
jgi:hypothetical protein